MSQIKISCILSNRTNYSKLKLVLNELRRRDNVCLDIVASSSILLDKYGAPFKDVEKDGFDIRKRIDCVMMNDSHEAMVKSAGISLLEHGNHFAHFEPDLLLVVGDRYDAFPGALAAAMMNVPIAHIQGGETTGTIDDRIRNLLSQIASLHFVATERSHERLLRWGLPEQSIFNFGCPAVEYISKIDVGSHFDPGFIKKTFKVPIEIEAGEKYFLVVVHPDTTNEDDVFMEHILDAVMSFNVKTFTFYPNVDANNSKIVSAIARVAKSNPRMYTVRHMPLEGFVHTMAHAAVMIGNSSAGIREAALFGTPVINIGRRQNGRERNMNTVDVVESNTDVIRDTIGSLMHKRFDKENIYYKPACSINIVDEMLAFATSRNGTPAPPARA